MRERLIWRFGGESGLWSRFDPSGDGGRQAQQSNDVLFYICCGYALKQLKMNE